MNIAEKQFFPYPNLAFAEDAPFLLRLRDKIGNDRVGLLDDVEAKSSTPDPEISHKLIEEELSELAVSDSRAFDYFMDNYSTSFSWFTGLFSSLFQCWSC